MDDKTKLAIEIRELSDYMKRSLQNYLSHKEENKFFIDNFKQILALYSEVSFEASKANPELKKYFVFNK